MKKLLCIVFSLFSLSVHADLLEDVSYRVDSLLARATALEGNQSTLFSKVQLLDNNQINLSQRIDVINNYLKDQIKSQKKVGMIYQGGMIFWMDETKQHGLIVSLKDIDAGQGVSWKIEDSGNKIVNAKGSSIYAGETNTRLIVSEQTIDHQKGNFAALLASQYRMSSDGITPCSDDINLNKPCYGNWYLSSMYELRLLLLSQASLNQRFLSENAYWSSTEHSVKNAWFLNVGSETPEVKDKVTQAHVRAISRF